MSAVVKMEHKAGTSITRRLADRFGVPEPELLSVLKQTAFRVKGNAEAQATDAQMTALMIVADQYGLNPFTKELYAYPDKQNGIVAVVSVDGWARIINEHPAMDGIDFKWSDESTTPAGGKTCPEWCESIIARKDRAKPTVIREYLDETYRPPFKGTGNNGPYEVNGPWQSHTKRMLRHKALIQGARIAFGFAGIYDDDEAQRIIERDITPQAQPTGGQPTVEYWSQADFDKNIAQWSKVIQKGTKTADEVIGLASSVRKFTDAQLSAIRAVKPPIDVEPVDNAKPEQLEALLAKASAASISTEDIRKKFTLPEWPTIPAKLLPDIEAFIANPMGAAA